VGAEQSGRRCRLRGRFLATQWLISRQGPLPPLLECPKVQARLGRTTAAMSGCLAHLLAPHAKVLSCVRSLDREVKMQSCNTLNSADETDE
jgi:hypothetical protein